MTGNTKRITTDDILAVIESLGARAPVILTTLPTDAVFNAITEDKMHELDLNVRCFTTIAGSFNGVRARVESEINLLEKRDFNVGAYRDALMASVQATQPFAGLMVSGGQVAVDADIRGAIDTAFSLLHEVDGNIRTANWFLDELAVANRQFTSNSEIQPRKLKLADGQTSNSMLTGHIAFAADPTALKQSSLAALETVKGHVEKRDMKAAQDALTAGKAFSGRMHMCNRLVERATLVADES